jgi:hypothetical protein
VCYCMSPCLSGIRHELLVTMRASVTTSSATGRVQGLQKVRDAFVAATGARESWRSPYTLCKPEQG